MLTIIQILIIFTKNFSRYQNRDVRLGGVNNQTKRVFRLTFEKEDSGKYLEIKQGGAA